MARAVIWTLNDAAMLLAGAEKEITKIFRKRGVECRFGDRRKYHNDLHIRGSARLAARAKNETHNLMFEQDIRFDEYFVPIPIKCIGGLFEREEEFPALKPIRALYSPGPGGDRPDYREYWDPGVAQARFPETRFTRMLTNACQGYYDIIDQEAAPDEQTILIGYSQGGLVARYLAFLDEHVFQKNRIHSVITLAAPNYGSPFANPDNRDAVARSLQKILRPLFHHIGSIPGDWADEISRSAVVTKSDVSFEEVLADLDLFIERSEDVGDRNTLLDLRKWVGGLVDDPTNAFWDLNPKRHGETSTVLADVNLRGPGRAIAASVCSAQNDIQVLLRDALSMTGVFNGYFGAWFFNYRKIFGDLRLLTEHYKHEVMNEHAPEHLPPAARERFEYYRTGKGSPEKHLPMQNERDHDFVVPTAYQVLANPTPFHSRTIRAGDHNSMRQRRGGGRGAYAILRRDLLPAIADDLRRNALR